MAKSTRFKTFTNANDELLGFGNRQKYPYRCSKELTQEERIFTLLLWVGVPGADAYLAAFDTNASRSSAAQMASRLAQSRHIKHALDHLWEKLSSGKLQFKPY